MQIPAKSPAASKNDPLPNLPTNNLNNQVKTNLKNFEIGLIKMSLNFMATLKINLDTILKYLLL